MRKAAAKVRINEQKTKGKMDFSLFSVENSPSQATFSRILTRS